MNSDRQTWFVVKSALLMFFINFGCGIIVPIIINVIDNAVVNNSVQKTLGSTGFQSICTWFVVTAFMCFIMWDDGKKNSAYGCCDLLSGILCYALVFLMYFFPAIFIDDAGENMTVFLSRCLYSCEWLHTGRLGYSSAAAFGGLLYVFVLAAVYLASHFLYVKEHPEI